MLSLELASMCAARSQFIHCYEVSDYPEISKAGVQQLVQIQRVVPVLSSIWAVQWCVSCFRDVSADRVRLVG